MQRSNEISLVLQIAQLAKRSSAKWSLAKLKRTCLRAIRMKLDALIMTTYSSIWLSCAVIIVNLWMRHNLLESLKRQHWENLPQFYNISPCEWCYWKIKWPKWRKKVLKGEIIWLLIRTSLLVPFVRLILLFAKWHKGVHRLGTVFVKTCIFDKILTFPPMPVQELKYFKILQEQNLWKKRFLI